MKIKWYVLFLGALTAALAVAAPSISLSVLFEEIAADLHLTVAQVGIIWGMGALPGIFTSLLGGAINDRLGPKRVVMFGTLLLGLTGASRALSVDFSSLIFTVMLSGMVVTIVITGLYKTIGIWFSHQQLGLAAGIISMGMALGFLLSSLLSASFFSPWLGGWRAVMYFYGLLALLLFVIWIFTPAGPDTTPGHRASVATVPMGQAIAHVASLRGVWLLGFALLGYSGCVQSTLGYLPLQLRQAGWSDISADSAVSSFHFASLLMVLPIAYLSDRLGKRKHLLVIMGMMTVTGIGFLFVAKGSLVFAPIILAGMTRDGFMALFMTYIIETDQVGSLYAGTATGLVQALASFGNFISPPMGNQLAAISPVLPYAFWALLAAAGIFSLSRTRRPSLQDSIVSANT